LLQTRFRGRKERSHRGVGLATKLGDRLSGRMPEEVPQSGFGDRVVFVLGACLWEPPPGGAQRQQRTGRHDDPPPVRAGVRDAPLGAGGVPGLPPLPPCMRARARGPRHFELFVVRGPDG